MIQLKTFSQLATVMDAERRAEATMDKLDRIERKRARSDRAVVCGVYRPDPVDRAAAMLLARAPWWAFAPSTSDKQKKEDGSVNQIEQRKADTKADAYANLAKRFAASAEELLGSYAAGSFDLEKKIEQIIIRYIDTKIPDGTAKATLSMVTAKDGLHNAMLDLGQAVDDLERTITSAVQRARSVRMSIVADAATASNALRDLRQFFLGPDYEREQKRLADFVDLCERMKVLKESGFLDTVADTMLRLAASDGQTRQP